VALLAWCGGLPAWITAADSRLLPDHMERNPVEQHPSLYVLTVPMVFAGTVLFVAAVVSWIGTRDETAQSGAAASLNA
jgi:hypothetical protein